MSPVPHPDDLWIAVSVFDNPFVDRSRAFDRVATGRWQNPARRRPNDAVDWNVRGGLQIHVKLFARHVLQWARSREGYISVARRDAIDDLQLGRNVTVVPLRKERGRAVARIAVDTRRRRIACPANPERPLVIGVAIKRERQP